MLCMELPFISEVKLIDYIPPKALFVFVLVPNALLLEINPETRTLLLPSPLFLNCFCLNSYFSFPPDCAI